MIALFLSVLVAGNVCADEGTCEYGTLPVDSKFTEQGFIWYKQSDYQTKGSSGKYAAPDEFCMWSNLYGLYRDKCKARLDNTC